jgi:putative phage-type endonuclease
MSTQTLAPKRAYKTQIISPEDKQAWLVHRSHDVTSTEVSALFGCSPYMTKFELWHRKKNGLVVEIEENTRMKWGTRLQDAIALGIAEDQGWNVRRMMRYLRFPELRAGSSFDFEIVKADSVLEIKNVDSLAFRDGWLVEEGEVEAPPHIELQVQHQMFVAKKSRAYIGALVGGNDIHLLPRQANAGIHAAIEEEVQKFWLSIEANEPPAPDFVQDAAFICQLYGYAEAGKVIEVGHLPDLMNLAERYRATSEEIKKLEGEKEGLKAQILMQLGEAEKATSPSFSISAGMIAGTKVEFERKPYRNFRINWKKTKKEAV